MFSYARRHASTFRLGPLHPPQHLFYAPGQGLQPPASRSAGSRPAPIRSRPVFDTHWRMAVPAASDTCAQRPAPRTALVLCAALQGDVRGKRSATPPCTPRRIVCVCELKLATVAHRLILVFLGGRGVVGLGLAAAARMGRPVRRPCARMRAHPGLSASYTSAHIIPGGTYSQRHAASSCTALARMRGAASILWSGGERFWLRVPVHGMCPFGRHQVLRTHTCTCGWGHWGVCCITAAH